MLNNIQKPKSFDIDYRSYKNSYGKYQAELERYYSSGGDYYDRYDVDAYIGELKNLFKRAIDECCVTKPGVIPEFTRNLLITELDSSYES